MPKNYLSRQQLLFLQNMADRSEDCVPVASDPKTVRLVSGLVGRGWIERGPEGTVCLTEAGRFIGTKRDTWRLMCRSGEVAGPFVTRRSAIWAARELLASFTLVYHPDEIRGAARAQLSEFDRRMAEAPKRQDVFVRVPVAGEGGVEFREINVVRCGEDHE